MHGGSLPPGFLKPGSLVDDDLELALIAANLADPARGPVAEYCFARRRTGAAMRPGWIHLT